MSKGEVFVFATCQVGAEPVLKDEITRNHRDLKPAFSRPGFVTFKGQWSGEISELGSWKLNSIFARAFGLSLGQAKTGVELCAELQKHSWLRSVSPLRLHVWERDRYKVGEEPIGWERNARCEEVRQKLAQQSGFFWNFSESMCPGDWVLDVMDVDESVWWLGAHQHSSEHSEWPGGIPQISLPEAAPSRAYLKLEEAILWSKIPLVRGDVALELGSSPGGASYALLQRGLRVMGVDPAPMSESVRSNSNFIHFQCSAESVSPSQVRGTQWLLMDVNIDPKQALGWFERIADLVSDSLLGVVLTLKLNHWRLAQQIPFFMERIEKAGLEEVRARQLAYNKQEICVVGLTRKGLIRRTRAKTN